MFTKIFTTRLKMLLRDGETLFWTLLFPIILASFFYMGLSGLRNADSFDPVAIASINDANWQAEDNAAFRETLQDLSTGEDALFTLQELSREEAEESLYENAVTAVIFKEDEIEMLVTQSGFGASIVQSFLNQYRQTTATVTRLISTDPSQAEAILAALSESETYIQNRPVSQSELDPLLGYFYALIGMSCFYGSILGLREVSEIQANQSMVAARVNVSPVHKMKYFLSSALASILVHAIQIILLLLFIQYVLGLDFGNQTLYIVLTCILGSLAGFAYGCFISSVVKASVNAKSGILISSTMLLSFFSGMMYGGMKHLIQTHVPILAYLNPVSLISDALYSLNYFDNYERFGLNMILLAAFTVVFLLLTYVFIRRPRYASI